MAAYRGTFVAAGQQVTDAPPGYRNSLKFTVSTAQSSLGTNDELSVLIPIEGVRAARLALGTRERRRDLVRLLGQGAPHRHVFGLAAQQREEPLLSVQLHDQCRRHLGIQDRHGRGRYGRTWLTDTGVGLYLDLCIAGGSSRVGTAGAWARQRLSAASRPRLTPSRRPSDTFQVTGSSCCPASNCRSSIARAFIMRPFDEALYLCHRQYVDAVTGRCRG